MSSHCPSHDADRYYAQIEQEEEFIDDMHLILTKGSSWLHCQCGPALRWERYNFVTDTHIQMEYICDNSECPIEAVAYIVALPLQHLPTVEYDAEEDEAEAAAHQELVDKRCQIQGSDPIPHYATQEEWDAFVRWGDGFYTAPEFLDEKFFLKTGKVRPKEEEE